MLPQVVLTRSDKLYKAPPEADFKQGDWVRVAQDSDLICGQVWQYGMVVGAQWVHHSSCCSI